MLNLKTKRDAAALRIVFDLAREIGLSEKKLVSGVNVTREDIFRPGAEIWSRDELEIISNLVQFDPDPTLGLRAGERQHVTTLGTLGYAMLASKDIRHALQIAARFHSVSLWSCDVTAFQNDRDLVFNIQSELLPSRCRLFCTTRGMASLNVWMSEMLGRDVEPSVLTLKLGEPNGEHLEAFSRCFGGQIEFGAPINSIAFDSAVLDEPLRFADRWTRLQTEDELEKVVERRRFSVANQVRDFILSEPGNIKAESDVCRALRLSSSTLRRRLREEGTSFRETRAEVLHQMACKILTNSTITVDEIANQLGYGEAASFVRAFKRKAKVAPGEWRRIERVKNLNGSH